MKIVFETATIADAIKKADRVAPRGGSAFDKSSGIVIDVDPSVEPSVTVRATNLDVYYREWVDTLSVDAGEGEGPVTWRVPSQLIAAMVGSLPIGSGKTVTFEEISRGHGSMLQVSSGRTKAKFNLMLNELYPEWDIFDPDDLQVVNDLGGRIALVEWAAERGPTVPINGIFFTGEEIITTDRYRLAKMKLTVPNMPDGGDVIVPAGILGSVLKQTGEVRVGFTPHQMLVMPDEATQLRVVRYDATFPPGVNAIMNTEREEFVEVDKGPLLEIMRRATAFAGADRMPTIRVFFGREAIAVMMDNADLGVIADVIDVPGYCQHDQRVEVKFTPKNLMEALDKAPNDKVRLGYNPSNPAAIMYLDGGSGYEAWVVTRREGEAG